MSPFHQTSTGRWQPDTPKSSPDGECTKLEWAQALCRQGLAAGIEMPWWYPLMSFEAAVGRAQLERER